MVAVTVGLAATSEHLARPVAAALYLTWMTAASMAIGLYWWIRRPASSFLLVALGSSAGLSPEGVGMGVAFNVGVLAEGPVFLLTFYLFAFPMGRSSRPPPAG